MSNAPHQLGPYEILDTIAMGGMGEVFLARLQRAAGFEKRVAVKRTRPELAGDPTFVAQFEREARIAAALNHRHIVQIFDFGRAPEGAWIAMEFVHGLDLKAVLDAEGTLPPGLVVEIGLACARGLDYAHRALGPDGQPLRLIHRDISPHNVLLSYEGDIKLADFGLAQPTTMSIDDGRLEGKLGYMSPEQAHGQSLDPRSDLFSLGVVLYEALTGLRAFHGPDGPEAILERARSGRPQAPLDPDDTRRPAPLCRVIDTLMAPVPADRYPTPEAAIAAFNAAAAESGLVVGDPPLGAWLRSRFPDRRSPTTGAPLEPTATVGPATPTERTVTAGAPLERTATAATPLTSSPSLSLDLPTAEAEVPVEDPLPPTRRRAWPALLALAALGGGGLWWFNATGTLQNETSPDASAEARQLNSDAALPDAAPPDAQAVDARLPDTGPIDTRPLDARPADAGPPDAGPPDTGYPDTGLPDAEARPSTRDAGRRRSSRGRRRQRRRVSTQVAPTPVATQDPPEQPPPPPPEPVKPEGPAVSLTGPGLKIARTPLSKGAVSFGTRGGEGPRVKGLVTRRGEGRILMNLTAQPHGLITLDGAEHGWTPRAQMPILPGRHTLILTDKEGRTTRITLHITP